MKKSIPHFRTPIIILTIFFLSGPPPLALLAQDYAWPTNASRSLTSSFAETRPTHFHSGIDIKTWGREGYKVFATRSGYIWRVRISPFGYGRVIYQILDTGETAVYAHLKKFSPRLENLMRKLQREQNRFSVTRIFKPYEYPVKRRDLIAYTGSTGIGSPHLHFEIREDATTPTNPLLKDFELKDTVSPSPISLAALPLNLGSQIDGWPGPMVYPVRKTGRNSYSVEKPVQIWGTIGFAVSAYDQANGVSNKFSVYRISMTLNETEIFRSTFDKFSFYRTNQIVLDRNVWLNEHYGRQFYNLFMETMNQLPFYHANEEGQGILYTLGYADSLSHQTSYLSWLLPEPLSSSPMAEFDRIYLHTIRKPYEVVESGTHHLRITLEDFNGNRSVVHVPLLVGQKQKPDPQWMLLSEAAQAFSTTGQKLTWARLNSKYGWQTIDTPDPMDLLSDDASPINSGGFQSAGFGPDTGIYKVTRTDFTGVEHFPIFIVRDNDYPAEDQFELKIIIKNPTAVVYISSNRPVFSPLILFLKNDTNSKELELTAHDLRNFTSWLPAYDLGDDSTTFSLYFKDDVVKKPILEKQVYYRRVGKDESGTIRFPESDLQLSIPSQASNQDLYFGMKQINPVEFELAIPGESISQIYDLSPRDVPFLKKVELSFSIPAKTEDIRQIGIYAPNLRKGKWNLVSNVYDEARHRMVAEVGSLGKLTLIRDATPPQVIFLYPGNGKTINASTPIIRIQYEDDLSGIGAEKDFRLLLDGEFCIAEWDPEDKQIRYEVEGPLPEGTHKLDFRIRDRAGNESLRSANFTVVGRQ